MTRCHRVPREGRTDEAGCAGDADSHAPSVMPRVTKGKARARGRPMLRKSGKGGFVVTALLRLRLAIAPDLHGE